MTEAVKQRTAARSWVTRTSNTLLDLLSKKVTIIQIKDAIGELDKHLDKLDDCQSKVEDEVEVDDLPDEVGKAADFREKARGPRIKALELIETLEKKDKVIPPSVHSNSHIEAKLPKLELPSFSGDILTWSTFWDQFTAVIENSELPDITKFTYLLSLLKGEAKQVVEGLSLTAAHYGVARKLLEDRYGRPERIIFTHIQELLNISVHAKPTLAHLRKLQDELLTHIRSLEVLGIGGDQYGVILTPLILSRLPHDIRMEWARSGEGKESNLRWLLEFLRTEIQRRERSQAFSTTAEKTPANEEKKRPSVLSLHTNSNSTVKCNICKKAHETEKCFELTRVTMEKRKEKIKAEWLCFRCLGKNHIAKNCSYRCKTCNGKHNTLLCENNTVSSSVSDQTVHSSSLMSSQCTNKVMLQIVEVEVGGLNGDVSKVNILFDSGSDRSYITSALTNKIKPKMLGSVSLSYAVFGSGSTSGADVRNVYEINAKSNNGECVTFAATEVPTICPPVFQPSLPAEVVHLVQGKVSAVTSERSGSVKVDILLGMDYYWQFMCSGRDVLSASLVAQETKFGWFVSGSLSQASVLDSSSVSHQLVCLNEVADSTVRRFWDLESIGISEKDGVQAPDPAMDMFEKSVQFENNRYVVSLPWKDNAQNKLRDNKDHAQQRLNNLNRKLKRDSALDNAYHKAIREMVDNDVVVEVPNDELVGPFPIFYMPHRPVVRESSVSTKIRPVFDASAKGSNGVSLNDCLHTGPNLIPNLAEILIRFRRWKVALTADITKAFLQIAVRREDQDVHRFLWSDEGKVKVMRFARVPFGDTSSPFLLNATIQHHLNTVPSTPVIEELKSNFYVDDLLTGADTDADACSLLKEATDVMARASLPLAKFGSNSETVAECIHSDFSGKLEGQDTRHVLGLKWIASEDCFTFEVQKFPPGLTVTKRTVLSFIARLFDPLGFLSPIFIFAKCIFQQLWKLGLDWDVQVPADLQILFCRWVESLTLLEQYKLPRRYFDCSWKDAQSIELHAFGDASEKGYGACVYIKAVTPEGKCMASLVTSKSRVAPVKKVTVPRLELLGAVLCARLLVFVRNALQLDIETKYKCWTDSMVALAWIRGKSERWKPFVENRVIEIQTLTDPARWDFCPGEDNPADLTTRGLLASELIASDIWLQGPPCLYLDTESDNVVEGEELSSLVSKSVDLEQVAKVAVTATAVSQSTKLFYAERWSSFQKSIRVVGFVLRFINNCRKKRSCKGDLTFEEMTTAKSVLFKQVQKEHFEKEISDLSKGSVISKGSPIYKLSPFLDEFGLLRVKGRLQMSELEYSEKHPLILPKCHVSLLLFRFQHKLLKHAGVSTMLSSLRNQYWIVGGRRLAKKVKKLCFSCQKLDAKASSVPMAPLPELRACRSPPFAVVGIDHTGAMYCADLPGSKFYVLLFTCAVVRAVHLELVWSLTAEETVLAIRRFSARRGLPSVIYCDNAKSFKGANTKMLSQFGDSSPEFKFIAPRSPWWGGWWERLVRSVKTALKRSIGNCSLTRRELEAVLFEVEACINSRPLTFLGDELDVSNPLTPAHFLIGRCPLHKVNVGQPPPVSAAEFISRAYLRNEMLDKFWTIWSTEYIRNLPPWQGKGRGSSVVSGSVVLIAEDNVPRLSWPVGVVVEVYPGRDGVVRTVKVHTVKGDYVRSVQRIHDLEVDPLVDNIQPVPLKAPQNVQSEPEQLNVDLSDRDDNQKQVSVSRYGRVRKAPKRYDD